MKAPATNEIIESLPRLSKEASLLSPASLDRTVSPPPIKTRGSRLRPSNSTVKSDAAKVEAGETDIEDHVSFFSSKLLVAIRPPAEGQPRLSHSVWLALYNRNLDDRGHHFVVHQHDHPIAGTHYDLRLQCNATSSISFALPYGLPGDPNSRRLNRNAIETRVHNLWNHLIETASHETGTMLLWDTGEYEVLPYDSSKANSKDDTTATEGSETDTDNERCASKATESEPQKLHRAFENRKIKLRLHGTRLPKNYTVSLRILKENNRVSQPDAPAFKRQKKTTVVSSSAALKARKYVRTSSDSSNSSSPISAPNGKSADGPIYQASTGEFSSRTTSPTGTSFDSHQHSRRRKRSSSPTLKRSVSSLLRTASPPPPRRSNSNVQPQHHPMLPCSSTTPKPEYQMSAASQSAPRTSNYHEASNSSPASDPDVETASDPDPETTTRLTNAYPGAHNTISSIHQRRWFLSLDRAASGFRPTSKIEFGRRLWERPLLGATRHHRVEHQETIQGSQVQTAEWKGGFTPFYVRGRAFEKSVLTGRLGADVARDEGLVGYKPRGGWVGITD